MTILANRFAFRAADDDLEALDAIAAGLRAAGHARITRTAALRFALATTAAKVAPKARTRATNAADLDAAS